MENEPTNPLSKATASTAGELSGTALAVLLLSSPTARDMGERCERAPAGLGMASPRLCAGGADAHSCPALTLGLLWAGGPCNTGEVRSPELHFGLIFQLFYVVANLIHVALNEFRNEMRYQVKLNLAIPR